MKSNDEKVTSSSWLACLASGGDQSRGSASKWRKPSCSLSTEPPSWLRSDATCDLKYVDAWTENTDSRQKHFFQCCTRRAADCAISIFQPFYNLLRCEHEWSSRLAQKVKLVVQICSTREIPKSLDHRRLSWNFSAKWFRWKIRTLWGPKILLFRKKRASGEVQLEGGVGAIRTKVQQLQLASRLGCPPFSLPARSWATSAAHAQWETGQGACAGEGQADVAQAHKAPYKTRRIWANQTWPWGECLSSGLEWEISNCLLESLTSVQMY